ncbi:hypothetical protein CAPTEDRAFT_197375 [Capitella teleta]|uniref:Uncharacterized protein n=1 Tax=Capitella teleta TaxID=283909 RepID=R7TXJ3_CAPTE|nr:hypothetical protein CAPTEDRAFT_197375 [Capitella teleta]|eukprot:ELT95695.1 hypothetical protein CAPTEDRAFT_197375 [Capitella teleta]
MQFFTVHSRKLSSLQSGGECQVNSYVEFSHICSVTNYQPSVDHCCCGHEDIVLCCSYHQNWNHFRCSEVNDVIGENVGPAVPWHIVMPSVLGGILAVALIVTCCVKAQCFKQDEDQDSNCCLGSKKYSPDAVNPSSSQSEMPDVKNSASPLLSRESRVSMNPSAPPEDDVITRQDSTCPDHGVYFRLNSETPSLVACAQCNAMPAPPTYDESREHRVLA